MGLRVGSKFIILIFGIHPSGVSSPPALAVRFLPRDEGDEEDGDEEDINISCWGCDSRDCCQDGDVPVVRFFCLADFGTGSCDAD